MKASSKVGGGRRAWVGRHGVVPAIALAVVLSMAIVALAERGGM